MYVVRACTGDAASLSWVVARFSPLLLAQARHRVAKLGQAHLSPDDLVQEVWAVAIPKLGSVDANADGYTQRLLGFLGRILLNLHGNLIQKHLRTEPKRQDMAADRSGPAGWEALPAETSGVVTRAMRAEDQDAVHAAIANLSPEDREIVILRAIEQVSNKLVASMLQLEPNTVAVKYRRALQRLTQQLPESVFSELDDD